MKLVALGGVVGVLVASGALAQEEPVERPTVVTVDHPTAPVVRGAVVHLDASDPGAEIQVMTRGERWTSVCFLPCDQSLDPRFEYRIGGHGLRATTHFHVPPDGQLSLRADMKPIKKLIVGAVLGGVGGILLLTGGTFLLLGAMERSLVDTSPCTPSSFFNDCANQSALNDTYRTASTIYFVFGTVLAVAGAAVMIPGIVFLAGGTRSTLESSRDVSKLRMIPGGFAF